MGFLTEPSGNNSAARLIFVIGSIWTMLLCTYFAIFSEITATALVIMFSAMETVWIGLKLGQKPMESKK